MDGVCKLHDFDDLAAIIGVLTFAVFSILFGRLLLLRASLDLAVEAEVLFDVEEHLLELLEFLGGLLVLGLERLHLVVNMLGLLTLLTFVFESQSLALLRRFSSSLLLGSIHSLALRQSRSWVPHGHITGDVLACRELLLVHPLELNLLDFSGFPELLNDLRTQQILSLLGLRLFGARKALGRRLFIVADRLGRRPHFPRRL